MPILLGAMREGIAQGALRGGLGQWKDSKVFMGTFIAYKFLICGNRTTSRSGLGRLSLKGPESRGLSFLTGYSYWAVPSADTQGSRWQGMGHVAPFMDTDTRTSYSFHVSWNILWILVGVLFLSF